MRFRDVVAAGGVLLAGVGIASAQVVSLEFHDGRVRLVAETVPVSRILAEWARLGGTKIVNGERVLGVPVTLQLLDVPEQQALDVVLRNAAGYIVTARDSTQPGTSVFDRILVLPTSTPAPAIASLPPPAQQVRAPLEDQITEESDQQPATGVDPQLRSPLGRLPPGRVQTGLNLPGVPPEQLGTVRDEEVPNAPRTGTPTPSSPFGVVGSSRPGVIAPVPPPQQSPADNPQQDRQQDR